MTSLETLQLLTPKEAAALLLVSTRTLYTWRKRGEGPRHIQITSRRIGYDRTEVLRWIEARREGAE